MDNLQIDYEDDTERYDPAATLQYVVDRNAALETALSVTLGAVEAYEENQTPRQLASLMVTVARALRVLAG
jgi:hypothetical protein